MATRILQPPEDLKFFVRFFWTSEWDGISSSHSTYYSTADICTKIIFVFGSGVHHPDFIYSGVQGQTYLAGQYPVEDFQNMLGISFYPYAIPLLFDIPAKELNNQMISLEDLIKDEAHFLNEKLATFYCMNSRLNFINNYLRSKMKDIVSSDKGTIQAMHHILQRNGIITINEFVKEIALSQKQFERKFLSFSGFTPKLYSRIVRFEYTLVNASKFQSLTELAYEAGYYDQAHFIHDFRKFSGFNPKQFFTLMEQNPYN